MTRHLAVLLAASALLPGCDGRPVLPAAVDTLNDACSWCRMSVSDLRFAAQIVAPGEEPKFFDDIGCLRSYLAGGARVPPHALAYVADHRTRAWVRAENAVYAELPGLSTPMSSGLVAHADAASRSLDPGTAAGKVLGVRDVFGAAWPREGTP